MKLLMAASIPRLDAARKHIDNRHTLWTEPSILEQFLKREKPTTLEGYIWCPADSSDYEKEMLIKLAYVVWEYKNFNNIMPNNIINDLSLKLKLKT